MKKLEINKVYKGNSLEVLKTFPDESLDMCITSPPYWGLRDYGTDGQVWGGDENCKHDFDKSKRKLHSGTNSDKGLPHHKNASIVDWEVEDVICNKCGAWKGELGLEPTPEMFINNLCDIFDEIKRCLRPHGTCWVNLGDSYCRTQNEQVNQKGINAKYQYNYKHNKNYGDLYKPKSLVQIPSRFAIEMTNRGWILRNELIWHKPSCMPASVTDRFTVDFEKLFFFTKNKKYYFKQQLEKSTHDAKERTIKGTGMRPDEMKRDRKGGTAGTGTLGRNKRTVWSISTAKFVGAHFAVYPPELIESPINAGCPEGGVVLDPFFGSGTTAEVAMKQDKNWVGIDLNDDYIKISDKRLKPTVIEKKTRDKAGEFWK